MSRCPHCIRSHCSLQARLTFPPRVLCVRGVALILSPLQPSAPRARSSQRGHSLCFSVYAHSGGRADRRDACHHCPNLPRALVLSLQWISETTACTSGTRSRKKFYLSVGNVPGRPSLGPDPFTLTMLSDPVFSFPRKLQPGMMSQPSRMLCFLVTWDWVREATSVSETPRSAGIRCEEAASGVNSCRGTSPPEGILAVVGGHEFV